MKKHKQFSQKNNVVNNQNNSNAAEEAVAHLQKVSHCTAIGANILKAVTYIPKAIKVVKDEISCCGGCCDVVDDIVGE